MAESGALTLVWEAPGPVAARFMASPAWVQILNGPIGSGKTTAVFTKALRLAMAQRRSSRDGVRKFKLVVVRDTYRQLWKTTLPTWFQKVPRDFGTFTGAENAPARHLLDIRLPADQSRLELIVDFVAIGDAAAEDVLRGYEPTAAYLNEADLLGRDVLEYVRGRVGRYPIMAEGGPSWSGVLADCNAPELHSWLYEDVFAQPPTVLAKRGIELFRQPSGLSGEAENLKNLPAGYYERQAEGASAWYVARMIENKPGYSRAGKPVYPEFSDPLHVAARELEAMAGVPLDIGLDAGLNPAAAFAQHMPDGQWRVLDELVGETGTGAARFARLLAQRLRERFSAIRTLRAWADPSAAFGADKQAGERSWIEIVEAESGVRVRAAPTNRLIPRLEAVRRPLARLIDGRPGLVLSPCCVTLRTGFNSGYRYRKMAVAEERYDEVPEKNAYSHPHDALQYALGAGGEDQEIRDRKDRRFRLMHAAGAPGAHVHEWDPFSGASTS